MSDSSRVPRYGNWVSTRLLIIPAVLCGLTVASSILSLAFLVPAAIFLLCFAYLAFARYAFSFRGGNVQAKIHELLLDSLEWEGVGKAIDIGCGNGPLTIKLAKKYPDAQVTGIDYWGGAWGYSKGVCEKNAELEGVAQRVTFLKASASQLPFEDSSFDAAVSNLTFHEVSDAKDKRLVIREALRVVQKRGSFAFQDLFLLKRVYGKPEELIEAVKGFGVESVELIETRDSKSIPPLLRLPFMVGTMAILRGKK